MPVLLNKFTTRIGLRIPFLYPKRIMNGGCVLIILILIRYAKKTPSGYCHIPKFPFWNVNHFSKRN
jgi:hypothetical protein